MIEARLTKQLQKFAKNDEKRLNNPLNKLRKREKKLAN